MHGNYAENIVATLYQPLLVLDRYLRVKTANKAFYKTFNLTKQETEGLLIYDLGSERHPNGSQWNIPVLRKMLEEILPQKSIINNFEVIQPFSSLGQRVLLVSAVEITRENKEEKLILLSIEDITERKKAEEIIKKTGEHFRQLVKGLPAGVFSCDADGYIKFYNDAAAALWGRQPVLGTDRWCGSWKIFNPGGTPIPAESCPMAIALKEGRSIMGEELIIERQDGSRSNVLVHPQPEFDLAGRVTGAINMVIDITEQVMARKKVEESELRFRSLADQVPIHIFIMEPAAGPNISYWNKNWLEYTGQSFEDALGSAWENVIHPHDVKSLQEEYTRAFKNLVPFHLPGIRVKRQDGAYRWFQILANPRFLPNGTFIGYIGIGVDIHESKLAADALKESESHFRLLSDLVPAKISDANARGDSTYFNKQWLQYTGMNFEELKDFGYQKVIHPDDVEEFKKRFRHSAETGTVTEMEMRLLNKEGAYVWHLYLASPVKDEHGSIKKWVSVTTDISDQKKQHDILEKAVNQRTHQLLEVNKELEQKHAELILTKEKLLTEYSRSLIEASPDPLVTINPGGQVTDLNQATVNITGISREELTGTNFFDYFTEPEKVREAYSQVVTKGYVTNAPLTLRHINGTLTDVFLNGSVYKDSNEKVLGVVLVARDVTEEKRIATELTEAIVIAQTATLAAEAAKIKAEEAALIAEDAVEAKQQFLSNMSHEIRTPMNAIIGFTKVVLKTELTAKQKEYLTAIKLSGNALIVLINDILDLAKVDAGKMSFEEIPFKMSSSISAMMHLFETKIQEKNLVLIKDYDDKIPAILLGDPVRLHQIILNLVSNAVKFTSKGTITVSLHLISEDEETATIEFAVTDTGTGIAENKTEKIFEKFHQASSETSRLYGGTGLGLSIVKQLVESQGGSMNVKTKIDEGSVFSFTLRFKKTDEQATPTIEFEEFATENKNIKVLVVEDIALNQLLMKTLLDDFGFDRDIAANG